MIDGLRGFAIFLVVLLHTWEISWFNFTELFHSPIHLIFFPATGFLGVDLFFFLSGFCLALPYARHRFLGTMRPTLTQYVKRRAVKILPSYWLMIAVTFFLFPHPSVGNDLLWKHVWTHLLFVHTAFLDTAIVNINGVVWSLAVEVQFYVLFPLIVLAFQRYPGLTFCGAVAIAQCWRAWTLMQFRVDPDTWHFDWHDLQLPGYLDLFVAGMAGAWLYVLWQKRDSVRRFAPLFTVVALLMFAGLLWEMYCCYQTAGTGAPLRVWHVQYRLVVALTFLAMAVSAAFAWRPLQKAIANPVMRFLSLISYNLYLWHQWIARYLMDHHIPQPRTTDPHDDPHWQGVYMVITWGVAILVATLITLLWEQPFLRGEWPWSHLAGSFQRKKAKPAVSIPGRSAVRSGEGAETAG